MAALAPAQASCVVQLQLADIMGSANPVLHEVQKNGFTTALVSDVNKQGFTINAQANGSRPQDTSKRKIQVRYRAGNCDSVTSGEMVCTDEDETEGDPYSYQDVEVKHYKKSKQVKLSKTEFLDLCSGISTEQTLRTAELAADLVRQMEKDLVTDYLAALNTYSDGDDPTPASTEEKTISLFSATAVPQPFALNFVSNEYSKKGYMDNFIMVGGYQINSWIKSQGLFVGNVDGADITKTNFDSNAYMSSAYDVIARAIGVDTEDRMASWMPGAIQRVDWLKYAPETGLARNTDEIFKGTINLGGEEFDILITDQDCNDFVTIQLAKGYGLFIPEAGVFGGTCKGQGTLLNWILDCGALSCATIK
jgi:hypothetical protein